MIAAKEKDIEDGELLASICFTYVTISSLDMD